MRIKKVRRVSSHLFKPYHLSPNRHRTTIHMDIDFKNVFSLVLYVTMLKIEKKYYRECIIPLAILKLFKCLKTCPDAMHIHLMTQYASSFLRSS